MILIHITKILIQAMFTMVARQIHLNQNTSVMETKQFIVFTMEGEDWVQESLELCSFEEANEFCNGLRKHKITYIICEVIKYGYNGN